MHRYRAARYAKVEGVMHGAYVPDHVNAESDNILFTDI